MEYDGVPNRLLEPWGRDRPGNNRRDAEPKNEDGVMKPIAVPSKYSDIISDTNRDIMKNNTDMTKTRMRIRHSVTAYDDPLMDQLAVDISNAKSNLRQLTEGLNTGVIIKSTI